MAEAEMAHELHEEDHVSERQYWGVFLILAVITAVEVAWSYGGFEGLALVLPLVAMMAVKFLFVAGVFMHLYFDLKLLHGRWFSLSFGAGLLLAVSVFAAVIATFHFRI